MSGPRILAIESSCDETGVAVVVGGRRIEANQVASQVALHAATGGIVPEVAARQQLRWIIPTLEAAIEQAEAAWDDIDAVAVTYGPGLIGSLLVGVNVAKALAVAHGKPLVGVNHIEGHIYANWLTDAPAGEPLPPEPEFPLLCLVVSGGHSQLVLMHDHGRYTLLGQTVDDAAGEAFDKVGRLLDLPYPGGAGRHAGHPSPACPNRWRLRLQRLRAQDRGAARGPGLPRPRRAGPGRRHRGRLRGGGGRRAGQQDRRGRARPRRGIRCARGRRSTTGSPRTACRSACRRRRGAPTTAP